MTEYLGVGALLALCTLVGTVLLPAFSVTDIAMLYLVAVALAASRVRRGPAVFAAFLSIALFDFFFVPPRFTFAVADLHYLITFAVMLASALTIGELAVRLQFYGDAARERERRTAELYAMSGELLPGMSMKALAGVITRHVRQAFDADVVVLLRDAGGRLAAPAGSEPGFILDEQERSRAQWAFDHWQAAGGTKGDRLPGSGAVFVPLVSSSGRLGVLGLRPRRRETARLGDIAVRGVLETFAGQAALAFEQARAFQAEGERASRA
ncbi:MAG TPA: DUF4118 domain-containing protein [Gemmatimonadales bacterium]|nr:DUF4118 domain-containing protein [Gemmatimonadales bacterium]